MSDLKKLTKAELLVIIEKQSAELVSLRNQVSVLGTEIEAAKAVKPTAVTRVRVVPTVLPDAEVLRKRALLDKLKELAAQGKKAVLRNGEIFVGQ
jgi:hypothetical protein